jgi:hypothetical protein
VPQRDHLRYDLASRTVQIYGALCAQADEGARFTLILRMEGGEIRRRGGEVYEIERRSEVAPVVADVADHSHVEHLFRAALRAEDLALSRDRYPGASHLRRGLPRQACKLRRRAFLVWHWLDHAGDAEQVWRVPSTREREDSQDTKPCLSRTNTAHAKPRAIAEPRSRAVSATLALCPPPAPPPQL